MSRLCERTRAALVELLLVLVKRRGRRKQEKWRWDVKKVLSVRILRNCRRTTQLTSRTPISAREVCFDSLWIYVRCRHSSLGNNHPNLIKVAAVCGFAQTKQLHARKNSILLVKWDAEEKCSWHLHQTFELFSRAQLDQYVTQPPVIFANELCGFLFIAAPRPRRTNTTHIRGIKSPQTRARRQISPCALLMAFVSHLFNELQFQLVRERITDIQVHRLGKLNKNAAARRFERTCRGPYFCVNWWHRPQRDAHTARIERVYFVPSLCVHVLHCLDAAEGDGKARVIKARERTYRVVLHGWLAGYPRIKNKKCWADFHPRVQMQSKKGRKFMLQKGPLIAIYKIWACPVVVNSVLKLHFGL